MHVRDILKEKGDRVVTIGSDCTVADAVRALNEHRLGSLVVLDADGGIAGIVTERDVLHFAGEAWAESPGGTDVAAGEGPVERIMSGDLVICVPDDDLEYVMGVMTQNRIRHLPVIEDGRLAGLISIGDVVRAQLNQHAYENRMLRDYIRSGDGAA